MGRFQKENLKATLEWSREAGSSRIRQQREQRLDRHCDNLDNLGIKIGIWMHSIEMRICKEDKPIIIMKLPG